MSASVYDIEVETLEGKPTTLRAYEGKVLLVVNTASKCGLTPQFEGLEALHRKYADRGLVVLGFPCNQFAAQDPGSAEQIGAFCQRNYGVSFPMHAKIDVNGRDTHPLYALLKREMPGLLGTESIKWNFTKFLIDRKGRVIARYAPRTVPADIEKDLERALAS